jgi:cell division initiation protein
MTTDLTPSQITGASFRTVRKGYDTDEVDQFLERVAAALEAAQQQATSMEARARAAVTRLHEVSAATPAPTAAKTEVAAAVVPEVPVETEEDQQAMVELSTVGAETISRTLLLAQLAADNALAEAESEAARIMREAQAEAEATIDSTREMSAHLVEEARSEARKATESERLSAENEVQSLKARREFLVGDVDQLEQFLVDQRERLMGAARQIEALVERVPSGLGHVRPPALSASDDEPGDDTAELFVANDGDGPFADVQELVEAIDQGDTHPIPMLELAMSEPDDDGEPPSESAEDLPKRGGNNLPN